MLQIFEVTKDSPWLPQVKALYESAFPANERIPMKQLLDNKIQREFFAFVDTIDGTPTFCGFSNSITYGKANITDCSRWAEPLPKRNYAIFGKKSSRSFPAQNTRKS